MRNLHRPALADQGSCELGGRQMVAPRVRFIKVIFPQAVSAVYPSLTSQFIFLFLTTGVISEIGVEELTHAGVFIDSRTFRSFEIFITLTIAYVAIALAFKAILHAIELWLFKWKHIR